MLHSKPSLNSFGMEIIIYIKACRPCFVSSNVYLWALYPGWVQHYVYLLSLVASDKVFPGAEPKCIVLYILALYLHIPSLGQGTRLAHTQLHNLLTSRSSTKLIFTVPQSQTCAYQYSFFFQVHFPVEQFAKGSITKQYYHVLTLKGSFHIDKFCFFLWCTCTLVLATVLPCVTNLSEEKNIILCTAITVTTPNVSKYSSTMVYSFGNIYARRRNR